MSTSLARLRAVVVVAAAVAPLVLAGPYLLHVLTLYLMYVIMALGLSLVVGYAGLLDVGYVAFFATGAYLYAVLNTAWGLPFFPGVLVGAAGAALLGVALGFPTLRVRGDYLALVTLAFGEIVRQILENWTSVTNGPRGIVGISPPGFAGVSAASPVGHYCIALGGALVGVLIIRKITRSPLALYWRAIRDDETAARACGIDATRWLLLAFAIGAAFAGFVGVLFAGVQRFVSPETFVLDESILILSIVVLSGGTSVGRTFIATAVLFGLPELLRPIATYRSLVFGVLLLAFIVGEELFRARRSIRSPQPRSLVLGPMGVFPAELMGAPAIAATLNVQDVTKNFGGVVALDGLNLRISLGKDIVSVIGPNGAGKTTLFDCISGLVSISEGRIEIEGMPRIDGLPAHRRAAVGIARTFQQARLFDSMTVRQNIQVGAWCREKVPILQCLSPSLGLFRTPTELTERVNAAVSMLGLGDVADQAAANLPTGIRRRVEIARALAMKPRLLLLDEVASGLNDSEKDELGRTLSLIARKGGVPIILVEHDVGFVTRFSDRVCVLDSGKLLTEGDPVAVIRDPLVIKSYLGTWEIADAVSV